MEMAFAMQNNEGHSSHVCGWIKALPETLSTTLVEFARKTLKIGQEDPRRIIHSLKVGLAITLVSLFYYFKPLYHGFGVSATWAVITVVVVFDFSVGATLSKGINRAAATILAATLGFGGHRLAVLSGDKIEPGIIAFFVFLVAAMVTFLRFFPRMKARYDYGLLIFILTFSLISVSGYRDDEVLDLANSRVSTILIGCLTAVFASICICPVWAGDDLHKLVAANIEKLGMFLGGFGVEIFRISGEGESKKASLQVYKSILNSKNTEESLANFARWEPSHGQFRLQHPWKLYLKIGSLTRQCACRIEALNDYLCYEIQIPPEIRGKIQESCIEMSSESGKALIELAVAIKTMTASSSHSLHIIKSKNAAENLKSLLNTSLCKDIHLLEIVPTTTVVSLLVDVISCTEKIADSVHELASLARFKSEQHQLEQEKTKSEEHQPEKEKTKSPNQEAPEQHDSIGVSHQVITVE